jgi:arylsulfatase
MCNARIPDDRIIDGKSLLPLFKGSEVGWSDRPLFFYWSRKYPELYNNVALQKGKFKIAGHADYNAEIGDFELFNIDIDPYEKINIISENKLLAVEMKKELDEKFYELVRSPNLLNPQRIIIGDKNENPVFLNRNDADGDRGIWAQEEIYGKWRVSISKGTYNMKFMFLSPLNEGGQMIVETGTFINQIKVTRDGLTEVEMKNLSYPLMDCELIPFYLIGTKRILPFLVEIEKVNDIFRTD